MLLSKGTGTLLTRSCPLVSLGHGFAQIAIPRCKQPFNVIRAVQVSAGCLRGQTTSQELKREDTTFRRRSAVEAAEYMNQ